MKNTRKDGAMNLWIDDLRDPPPSDEGWLIARTSAEALNYLEASSPEHPFPHISFDHDLGGDDTTRPVMLYLCEHPDKAPKTLSVHSMNPVGKEYLVGMARRYLPATKVIF